MTRRARTDSRYRRYMVQRISWLMVLAACGGSTKGTAPPVEPTANASSTEQPAAGTTSPTAPAETPSSAPTPACIERSSQLGAAMRELAAAQPGFLPMVQGITAPVSASAKPIDTRGVVIAVTRDGAMFSQGYPLASIGEVREYLEQIHRQALEKTILDGGTAADATVPLYIWADRTTPIRTVAAVAAAVDPEPPKPAKAGKKAAKPAAPDDDPPPPEEEDITTARQQAIQAARDAGLIGPGGGKRPPAFALRLVVTSADHTPALAADIAAKLPPTEPAATQHVVDQLKRSIGSCAPIITALGTATLGGTPAKEAAKLIAEVPAGLTACQCKVADLDGFEWGVRAWFGAWAPPLRWIDVPKLKATDKRPIGKLIK